MTIGAGHDYALIGPNRDRWSPRAFSSRELTSLDLRQLLEAARWAASCFNEQPSRFVVARRGQPGHDVVLSCLGAKNQRWARNASALIIASTSDEFAHNGKPNRWAAHDLGLALGALSAQATSMGIVLHQMAGFDQDAARERLGIPAGITPMTAIAVGFLGTLDELDESFHEAETKVRTRKPHDAFAFGPRFGEPLVDDPSPWDDILSFWFGELDEDGLVSEETSARWFKKDPAFDATVRDRFSTLHAELAAGAHADWMRSARGALATVITLDQFPRNMHRDTPEMYATDDLAATHTLEAIELGFDLALPMRMRSFLYMPLMHSESAERQERCVDLFARCAESEGPAQAIMANMLKYAVHHRDIVVRFGRFPHRNAILGRESTETETEFLAGPGSSF